MSELELTPATTKQFKRLTKLTFSQTQKDLFAGSLAGLMIVITGHPLDTIKVRMQMLHTSFWGTCKSLIQNEGLRAFYKGAGSPMYSTPLTTSMSFAAYESANRLQGLKPGDKRTVPIAFLSGAWSGLVYGVTITPIELLKTRLQMEGIGDSSKSTKLSTMVKNIVKYEGFSGLFKGLGMTLVRDIPSLAVQFAVFEGCKEEMNKRFGESSFSSFLAGGFSVLWAWIVAYPQDTIKTKIQCSQTKLGVIECTRDIYNTAGFKGFWKGLSPCLARAILTGATRYIAYDKCQELIGHESQF